VFRGAEALGKVQYDFTIEDTGRVIGSIVHIEHLKLHPIAPRVPMNFLPQSAGISTDLHLALEDGTVVDFLVVNTDGEIENGRCRPANAGKQ
jgi:hypothetical protein